MIDNLMLGSMAIDEDGKQIRTIRERNSWDVETDDRVIIQTDWAIKSRAK